MENQKMNPWMVSTLVLVGIIIGFGVSQIPALKNVGTVGKTTTVQPPPSLQNEPKAPEKTPLTAAQVQALPDDDPGFGEMTAPLTLVEFSDFQCPVCKRFVEQTLTKIDEDYIKTGKVRFVYRDYPLDSHPQAPLAALVSNCATEQGKFREMHDAIFTGQAQWSGSEDAQKLMRGYGVKIGLNMKQYDSCISTKKYADEIKKDIIDGVSLGVTGTPGFFVNGKEVSGLMPYEQIFKPILDAELAGKKWELQEDAQGRVSLSVQ